MIIFIDDILVYSATEEEHAQYMWIVLQTLREQRLYAKFLKCDFGQQEVKFIAILYKLMV